MDTHWELVGSRGGGVIQRQLFLGGGGDALSLNVATLLLLRSRPFGLLLLAAARGSPFLLFLLLGLL